MLSKWYKMTTTTKDRNGIEYISTMEGNKYPFFGGCSCWGGGGGAECVGTRGGHPPVCSGKDFPRPC